MKINIDWFWLSVIVAIICLSAYMISRPQPTDSVAQRLREATSTDAQIEIIKSSNTHKDTIKELFK
jgi:hypothetical protein